MQRYSQNSFTEEFREEITQHFGAFQFPPKKPKSYREYILETVKHDGYALCYANPELQGDKDIVLEAVKQNGNALYLAHEILKANKDIVLAAVNQNGDALYHASAKLQVDEDVVLEAVKQNGHAIRYADQHLIQVPSFFWQIWNIQTSKINDVYRKDFIVNYLLKENAKILLGASLTTVSGLLLSGIIIFPIPSLVVLIMCAISAVYTGYKVTQHGYGFFKAYAERELPDNQDVFAM